MVGRANTRGHKHLHLRTNTRRQFSTHQPISQWHAPSLPITYILLLQLLLQAGISRARVHHEHRHTLPRARGATSWKAQAGGYAPNFVAAAAILLIVTDWKLWCVGVVSATPKAKQRALIVHCCIQGAVLGEERVGDGSTVVEQTTACGGGTDAQGNVVAGTRGLDTCVLQHHSTPHFALYSKQPHAPQPVPTGVPMGSLLPVMSPGPYLCVVKGDMCV